MENTRELVKALAAATGLRIADDRLDLVAREYEHFMRLVAEIEQHPLPAETEPRAGEA